MKKHKREIEAEPGYWEKQVLDFCEMFGFRLAEKLERKLHGCEICYSLKFGRSSVAYKDASHTWCSGELQLCANVGCANVASERNSRKNRERAMENIVKRASGKELIVRSSDKDRKTPYGFTKVRLIRHILLPEFGSVEELKLKLAVMGK